METLTRKKREIQDREKRILDMAHSQILREGYHGLSMDRIASEMGYSKGTIYNHFPCKEEIIVALGIRVADARTALFDRAARSSGTARQRISAIGAAAERFVQEHPDLFELERLISTRSIWEKISESRRFEMRRCEQTCIGMLAGIVRDAVSAGDLPLSADLSPEQVVFGLWSASSGAYAIIATRAGLNELGIDEPFLTVRRNINAMLDGLGWRPMSSEFDYIDYYDVCLRELFGDRG